MDMIFSYWKTKFFVASSHEAPSFLRMTLLLHYHLDVVLDA